MASNNSLTTLSNCKILVKFEHKYFETEVNPESTIADVEKCIKSETKLETHYQKFSNVLLPESSKDEDCKLSEVCLQSVKYQPCSSSTGRKDFRKEEPNFLIAILNQPRTENLLVLDIDHTIYDVRSPTPESAIRPYLENFLESVAEYYDIAIWSATPISAIARKLKKMNIFNNPKFKLLFCLDEKSMTKVPYDTKISAKNLNIIWEEYPQYNSRNTIICDDLTKNFYYNPKNGVKIAPYNYWDSDDDCELMLLLKYLNYIRTEKDFSAMDHSQWKTVAVSLTEISESESESSVISLESDTE